MATISRYAFVLCVLSRFSGDQFFATLWTVALQAPLSMGFFRQEYWSGVPCPPLGDFSLPKEGTLLSYVSCFGRQLLYR